MNTDQIEQVALTVRMLTIDAIDRAQGGHSGLPLGCAELGGLVFGEVLRHYPTDPLWIDRDRFVLSAGHGSMLLYALLHLSGYDVSLEDLKSLRRLGSKTPGHPEYGVTPGVEVTTGPLGQGFANAVGMALAERILAARFNTPECPVIDHFTYVLAGDGDLMEGITAEAASLAGHLGLGKLIVFYDSNGITIDGATELSFTEDVIKRFESYDWQTLSIGAYDIEGILSQVEKAKAEREKPTIIRIESLIGKGAPTLEGLNRAHGGKLSPEDVARTKKAAGVAENQTFFKSEMAVQYFESRRGAWKRAYDRWQDMFLKWRNENPDLFRELSQYFNVSATRHDPDTYSVYRTGTAVFIKEANSRSLEILAASFPNIVGGTADLTNTIFDTLRGFETFNRNTPSGSLIHFGIREHAMAAVCNGLALHGGLKPFCGTFLVFSDYMRPAIRLAALMKIPVVFVFTHDSIFVGPDGPTHQAVEQLAALRAIPGLRVLRPGDAQEVLAAWEMAFNRTDGPTAIVETRSARPNTLVYTKTDPVWFETIRQGAYIVRDSTSKPDVVIVATGSEVQIALQAAERLEIENVRVVSMICRELFLSQESDFRKRILPDGAKIVVIEAGNSQGWHALYVDLDQAPIVSIESFGRSGTPEEVADFFGFSAGSLAEKVKKVITGI